MSESTTARRTGPDYGIAGRVAVVTGSASGIGRAVVCDLREAGVRVAGIDLQPSADADFSVVADVGDAAAVRDAFAAVEKELGGPSLALHAAGITRDAVLWKVPVDAWEAVLRVNLSGAFHLLREMVPHVRVAGGGSIVFVGSINGTRGKFGQSAYAASKAGLVGLARTAARELGRFGVRVNVVAPGMVDTPMTQDLPTEWRDRAIHETVLGRIATPQDVAGVAAFLLSERARHVTGQLLHVDGGQHM